MTNNGRLPIIAMDTWILSRRYQNHGVHVYARHLLQHFQSAAAQECIIFKPFVSDRCDNVANGMAASESFQPVQAPLLQYDRLWRVGGASYTAARSRQDVIFSPHYHTMFMGDLTPAVITVHDVTPRFVKLDSLKLTALLRFFIWWSARYSRTIITDSICSRNDLIRYYGVPEDKISVVYLGYDKARFNRLPADPLALAQVRAKFGLTRPYIFNHGVDKPNKNLSQLVQAFQLMRERNPNLDLDLVLAGPMSAALQNQVALNPASSRRGRIILTQAINDDDLASWCAVRNWPSFPRFTKASVSPWWKPWPAVFPLSLPTFPACRKSPAASCATLIPTPRKTWLIACSWRWKILGCARYCHFADRSAPKNSTGPNAPAKPSPSSKVQP